MADIWHFKFRLFGNESQIVKFIDTFGDAVEQVLINDKETQIVFLPDKTVKLSLVKDASEPVNFTIVLVSEVQDLLSKTDVVELVECHEIVSFVFLTCKTKKEVPVLQNKILQSLSKKAVILFERYFMNAYNPVDYEHNKNILLHICKFMKDMENRKLKTK